MLDIDYASIVLPVQPLADLQYSPHYTPHTSQAQSLLLPPLLHNLIHQPKRQRLGRRHKVIPLQRAFYHTSSANSSGNIGKKHTEPILRIRLLFPSNRAMLRIHLRQQLAHPQDLFGVDGNIRRLA